MLLKGNFIMSAVLQTQLKCILYSNLHIKQHKSNYDNSITTLTKYNSILKLIKNVMKDHHTLNCSKLWTKLKNCLTSK